MKETEKQLLVKYFYGTCTPDEIRRVHVLLEDPVAQAFIRELSWKEWNEPLGEQGHERALFQVWKAKANAHIRANTISNGNSKSRLRRLIAYPYAALWLLAFIGIGFGIWQGQRMLKGAHPITVERQNEKGAPVCYILPDSSRVYLAAGSTIRYPASFSDDSREVNLEGEAFFEIQHHPHKAFIVHSGVMQTRVLGTSFKVLAVDERPMEVAVATGKVAVSVQEEELTTLTPGYKVVLDRKTKQLSKEQIHLSSLARWKSGDFVYEKLEMVHIANDLQNRFGIKMEFVDNQIKNNRVTGTFDANQSIENVLKTLAVAGNFHYEIKDSYVKIYKTE